MYNKIAVLMIGFVGFIIPIVFSVSFSPMVGGDNEGIAVIITLLSVLCSIVSMGIYIIYFKLNEIYKIMVKREKDKTI